MTDDLPDYLRGQTVERGGLRGLLDEDFHDKDGVKEISSTLRQKLSAPVALGRPAPGGVPEVEWLLRGDPRPVQLEALRRSYYGVALLDSADAEPEPRIIRETRTPALGWGHFMQMRLGKTPTALNEFALLRRDHGFKRMIMLGPNAYKRDWVEEADRFGLDVPGLAFQSSNRTEVSRFVSKSKGEFMLSVNYEALGYKATMTLLEELCDEHTYIGGDESIWIKGPNSNFTRNAVALAKLCGARRPLTGKPITQGAHDLWSQLRFAAAISGVNYTVFRNRFCKMGGYMMKEVKGAKNPEELRSILHHSAFVARRTDWMTTPGVEYGDLQIDMLPEQKVHYTRMEKEFITELENGTVVTADQAITKYIKLGQIASGFIIDEMGTPHDIMPLASNPKINAIKRLLEEQIEGKCIIFVHHRHTVEMLTEALKRWNPAFILGRQKDTIEQKARYNGDPNCRVMIGQIQAVRYGHTLMGSPDDPTTTEIWAENNYSLNDRSQGEERPQGAGQRGVISILDLYATPQERKIVQCIQRKEDVASLLLGYARGDGVLPRADD